MNNAIYEYLVGLEFGEIVQFKNMAMVPLFSRKESRLVYLALDEAVTQKSLVITEVSSGGSVPELKVINNAGLPVLLLDGEEIQGGKQHRILNTTILVKEKSTTVIPVSCCEHGRWHYSLAGFSVSPQVMPASIRSRKLRYVHDSLRQHRDFRSDQREVWNDIQEVHNRHRVHSDTGAMKDAFELKAVELEEYIRAFALQPEQNGALFFLNGEVLGFDIVSQVSAYKVLHPKLVRSYTLDIAPTTVQKAPSTEQARDFIQEALRCRENHYRSPGIGLDFRYEDLTVTGSALINRDDVVHAAFFRTVNHPGIGGRMAGYLKRANINRLDVDMDRPY